MSRTDNNTLPTNFASKLLEVLEFALYTKYNNTNLNTNSYLAFRQ